MLGRSVGAVWYNERMFDSSVSNVSYVSIMRGLPWVLDV